MQCKRTNASGSCPPEDSGYRPRGVCGELSELRGTAWKSRHMQAPASNYLPLLIFVPLIAWRLYARVRRNIGRQHLGKVRPWVSVILFPLIVVLIAFLALPHPLRILWLAGGIAGGVLLGVYGLGKTRFENTPQGLFYTPNAHLGIALS